MIIRSGVQCHTCQQKMTVRIGMGQGTRQEHTISCPGCKEPIQFGMIVDYENISTEVFSISNCEVINSEPGTQIFNVDANFVIPEGMENSDFTFHRFDHLEKMMQIAEASGATATTTLEEAKKIQPSKDYLAEWLELKRVINLTRNGRFDLAKTLRDKATKAYHPKDPLRDNSDWIFRFSMKICGFHYGKIFKAAVEELGSIVKNHDVSDAVVYIHTEAKEGRARKYFEIFDQFFQNYHEFSQVHPICSMGIPLEAGHSAMSNKFESVKTFYGDAFEVLASSALLFTILNNLKSGRPFDKLSQITLEKYIQLDNSSKFNAFGGNKPFSDVCAEQDNQIRNASHHKGIYQKDDRRTVAYRAGKGGTGTIHELSYTEYLYRSTAIFLQIAVLLMCELILIESRKLDYPI